MAVTSDWPVLLALALLVFFIALPAIAAWRRRGRSRLAIEAASDLAAFAERVRRDPRALALDDALATRLMRLRLGEMASLQLALALGRNDALLVADSAQRLALRLRRRVAFERKMLARTASGLRRGAVAASIPPVLASASMLAGIAIPAPALCMIAVAEAIGCVLLWQFARVEI
jgi:hypothetical protein